MVEDFGIGGVVEIGDHSFPRNGFDPFFRFAAGTADDGWASFATSPATRLHLFRFNRSGIVLDDEVEVSTGHAFINLGLHQHGDRLLAVLHHPNPLEPGLRPPSIRVLAFDENGEPDADYGQDGTAVVELDRYYLARGSALLTDGSVLVLLTDQQRSLLLRIAGDGSGLDAPFGENGVLDLAEFFGDGKAAPGVDGQWIEAVGLGVHEDRIIVGGIAGNDNRGKFRLFALAVDAEGNPVPGYGLEGKGIWISDEGDFLMADAFTVDAPPEKAQCSTTRAWSAAY